MDSLNYLGKTKQQLIKEFQEFYYKKAAPLLPDYEIKRNKDKYNVYLINAVILGFIFLLIGFESLKIIGIFLIFASVVIISVRNGNKKTVQVEMDYEVNLKKVLMPEFLSLFGVFKWFKSFNVYDKDGKIKTAQTISKAQKQFYKMFSSLKIIPFFHLFILDDVIEGVYHDVSIRLLETKFGYKAINLMTLFSLSLASVFIIPAYLCIGAVIIMILSSIFSSISSELSGIVFFIAILVLILLPVLFAVFYFIVTGSMRCLVVEIDMNKNFNGNTCVYENGITNKKLKFKKRPELKTVQLEDIKFNKLYNVESTDQIEARYLLTTAFIERFLNIKTSFKAQYIRAEFKDSKLYIILGVDKDLFAMGNISKKTTGQTFVELFEEMYSVLSLVDELKLNQKIGL